MTLTVLLFAAARERAGQAELPLEVPDELTARALVEAAVAARPPLAAIAGQLRVAVNQRFVAADAVIRAGDEVALLPPVSGGAGAHLRILDAPLSLDRVIRAVRDEAHGAIATFTPAN